MRESAEKHSDTDERDLARICKLSRGQLPAVKEAFARLFLWQLQHKRIEQELQNARTLSDKRREADHRRALKYNEKNWRRARMSLANARARTIGKSVTILIPPERHDDLSMPTYTKPPQNHIKALPEPTRTTSKHHHNHPKATIHSAAFRWVHRPSFSHKMRSGHLCAAACGTSMR
jgi:uncharacterized protein YdaU (DUF1376 family)